MKTGNIWLNYDLPTSLRMFAFCFSTQFKHPKQTVQIKLHPWMGEQTSCTHIVLVFQEEQPLHAPFPHYHSKPDCSSTQRLYLCIWAIAEEQAINLMKARDQKNTPIVVPVERGKLSFFFFFTISKDFKLYVASWKVRSYKLMNKWCGILILRPCQAALSPWWWMGPAHVTVHKARGCMMDLLPAGSSSLEMLLLR